MPNQYKENTVMFINFLPKYTTSKPTSVPFLSLALTWVLATAVTAIKISIFDNYTVINIVLFMYMIGINWY